jgi:hypothetical protein
MGLLCRLPVLGGLSRSKSSPAKNCQEINRSPALNACLSGLLFLPVSFVSEEEGKHYLEKR